MLWRNNILDLIVLNNNHLCWFSNGIYVVNLRNNVLIICESTRDIVALAHLNFDFSRRTERNFCFVLMYKLNRLITCYFHFYRDIIFS